MSRPTATARRSACATCSAAPSRRRRPGPADGTPTEPAGVEWRGTDLVTTTVYRVNGMPVKQVRTHRLSPSGREMTVETRVEMQHGYESDHPEYKSGSMVTDVFMRADH